MKLLPESYHRWILLFPMTVNLVFVVVFYLIGARFFESVSLASVDASRLQVGSALLLVILAVSLTLISSCFVMFVCTLHFLRIWHVKRVRNYYLAMTACWILAFAIFHAQGLIYGSDSNFLRLTRDIVVSYLGASLPIWGVSERQFTAVYAVIIGLTVASGVALSITSSSLAFGLHRFQEVKRDFVRVKRKRSMVLLSFFSAVALISSMVFFLFTLQNAVGASLTNEVEQKGFSAIVFGFSSYWGLAYSVIVAATFGPIFVGYNMELATCLEKYRDMLGASEKDLIEKFSVRRIEATDLQTIVGALAPLLTALGANSLFLFSGSD